MVPDAAVSDQEIDKLLSRLFAVSVENADDIITVNDDV